MPAWLAVLKVVLHYAIAGSGIAALLRERRLPSWAIAFGTAAFVLAPRLDKLEQMMSNGGGEFHFYLDGRELSATLRRINRRAA